jgi:hypothetical protein
MLQHNLRFQGPHVASAPETTHGEGAEMARGQNEALSHVLHQVGQPGEQNSAVTGAEGVEDEEMVDVVNPETGEVRGPRGLEPTRHGDWEFRGRCTDFS